jgi:hypothetical protein
MEKARGIEDERRHGESLSYPVSLMHHSQLLLVVGLL